MNAENIANIFLANLPDYRDNVIEFLTRALEDRPESLEEWSERFSEKSPKAFYQDFIDENSGDLIWVVFLPLGDEDGGKFETITVTTEANAINLVNYTNNKTK